MKPFTSLGTPARVVRHLGQPAQTNSRAQSSRTSSAAIFRRTRAASCMSGVGLSGLLEAAHAADRGEKTQHTTPSAPANACAASKGDGGWLLGQHAERHVHRFTGDRPRSEARGARAQFVLGL